MRLRGAGVPCPDSLVVGRQGSVDGVADLLGPPPWIVKLPMSAQGAGVALAESAASLRAMLDLLQSLQQRVLVQRFVAAARGTDIRVLVLRGKARGAMRRRAGGDEIRSNIHRGGKGEAVILDTAATEIAEAAAVTLGVDVAGVDLLESDDGYLVCEVNGSPGLRGLQQATGRDFAAEIIELLADVAG